MLNYKIKIGLVPIRRNIADAKNRKGMFQPSYAQDNKDMVIQFLDKNFRDEITDFCDLEWLNEEGLLYDEKDCEKVKEYFEKEKVNAIFIVNCNFGNEEAAGRIAKMMNVPTLLWGPLDVHIAPDGTRFTDTQCGLFAISKQLQRLSVPFSYIENCKIDDEKFKAGFESFLAVSTMVNNFKNLKLGLMGTRMNPFKSVMANELELTEKFGINLQNINLAVAKDNFDKVFAENYADIEKLADEISDIYDVSTVERQTLLKMTGLVFLYKKLFEDFGVDAITSECWTALPLAIGALPCLAMSILSDMGYIVTCETDLHGVITQVLLTSASRGKKRALFGEFTCRHLENKNAELLWHCGPFPYSAKHDACKAKIFTGKPCFYAKDGTYTISRFQGAKGKYYLLGGTFETVPGPETSGTYMWAQFKDLSRVEEKLINGPYIHHMSEMYGDLTKELKEFCKYIPEIEYDILENY